MEQAPNVFILFFAETTITFGWNIPGDTPIALKILRVSPNPVVFGEFTPNDPGFFADKFQDTGLQPGTLFTYQVCCEYSDQTLCGTVSHRTRGTPPPPPKPTITITGAQAFPARLVRQMNGKYVAQENSINLTWKSSVEVFGDIRGSVTAGGVTTGLDVGGPAQPPVQSGTLTANMFDKRVLGLLWEVRIVALPVTDQATQIISQSVAVQDPANTHSVRAFLSQSGIDPSKGIRNLLQTLPVSFRGMMQI